MSNSIFFQASFLIIGLNTPQGQNVANSSSGLEIQSRLASLLTIIAIGIKHLSYTMIKCVY